MELKEKIEAIEKEFYEKLNALKQEASKTSYKRTRVEIWEYFFYINYYWDISRYEEEWGSTEEDMYNIWNYYRTEEEAEKELNKIKAIVKINDRIDDLNQWWIPNWKDEDEEKYYIFYCHHNHTLWINYKLYYEEPHFIKYIKDKSLAKKIIQEFIEELNLIFNIK